MAPEQLQSCMDACNLCADACERLIALSATADNEENKSFDAAVIIDCAGICRLAALSLKHVSRASSMMCEACAQISDICANECDKLSSEEGAQCVRSSRHCAEECRRMAQGIPPVTQLA